LTLRLPNPAGAEIVSAGITRQQPGGEVERRIDRVDAGPPPPACECKAAEQQPPHAFQ
jgi:hypothetical protein